MQEDGGYLRTKVRYFRNLVCGLLISGSQNDLKSYQLIYEACLWIPGGSPWRKPINIQIRYKCCRDLRQLCEVNTYNKLKHVFNSQHMLYGSLMKQNTIRNKDLHHACINFTLLKSFAHHFILWTHWRKWKENNQTTVYISNTRVWTKNVLHC